MINEEYHIGVSQCPEGSKKQGAIWARATGITFYLSFIQPDYRQSKDTHTFIVWTKERVSGKYGYRACKMRIDEICLQHQSLLRDPGWPPTTMNMSQVSL